MNILTLIVYFILIFKVYKLEKQVKLLQKDTLKDIYKHLDIDYLLNEGNDSCEEKI